VDHGTEAKTLSELIPLVGDISVGGISGFAVGYFMKKMAKLFLFLLGAYVLSLYGLANYGIVSFHPDKAELLLMNWLSKINISLGAMSVGFMGGLYLGVRRG